MSFNPFSVLAPQDIPPICMFNTGTFYDLQSGDLQIGYDGKWYIRGGFGAFITAILGRGNSFKSTLGDSFIARMLAIYHEMFAGIYDNESIKDHARFIRCAGGLIIPELEQRVVIRFDTPLGEVWDQLGAITNDKEKHRKDLMVETPFVNPRTDERLVCWAPTVVFMDSLTETRCLDELKLLTDGLDEKTTKTAWLVDGNKKAMFLRHLRPLCERYGLIVILTGAIGDNSSMDPMAPPTKQLPFMKQRDRSKGLSTKITTIYVL